MACDTTRLGTAHDKEYDVFHDTTRRRLLS